MVDTSGWGGLPDVKMDHAAASLLAGGCESAATAIRSQVTRRKALTTSAMQDFEGRFSRLFHENQQTADKDGHEVADALDAVAKAIRYIIDLVPEENARRRAAREWKARHDKDKAEGVTWSDLGGDEAPPEGPGSPPPPPQLEASATPRETPQPGSGGSYGAGTSSARPDELRGFATGMAGSIQGLDGRPGRLSGLNADFTAGFDWGIPGQAAGVDGSTVYQAFRTYNQLNQQDRTWVDAVASAFEQAGGSGAMVTLSNAALASSIAAAGVSVTRLDIAPTSPRMYGISPTTGYADDPVNTATGNFVEPETDVSFEGGCGSLTLTRMYNSFQRDAGGFGPGWSSWSEVRLSFDEEAAQLRLPDGRVLQFPRLGDGWGRALGASTWLERDEVADELRVTDNAGGTWRFTRAGLPLSHDRGEGTLVAFVREGERLVRLQHERGRHVALTWDGDRIVAVETSDGRRTTYAYDDQGRLTGATGPAGTRTYRWDDAGLVAAVVDADGVVEVENTYDDLGRVLTQLSPHGRTSRYTYLPGNVTEVADPDGGRANTWIHDTRGNLVGFVDSDGNRQSTSYDQHDNPVTVTERDGSVTVRKYDDRGRVVREVSPSGSDLRVEHDERDRVVRVVTDEGAETRFAYDGAARNPSLWTDPEGGETRLEWAGSLLARLTDPTGVALCFAYDDHGDLVGVTNAVGDTARFERDAAGRVVAATTPSGHRTTYVHGPAGVTSRRDPDGSVWHVERTAAGRVAAVVDPTGSRTTMEHGDDGEERRRVDPIGRGTEWHHDDLGNLSSVVLPDGSTWRFTHDALSRPTSMTAPDGATWTQVYGRTGDQVEVVDPLGHRTSVVEQASGRSFAATDASGTVTHRFDALGRPVSAEQPDGSVAVATYDRCGRVVEQLDAEGGLTRIARDAAGRPVSVTDPTGRVTRFEHDEAGRRTAVVAPDGGRTTFRLDADGRVVRTTTPTGEVGWIDYDACGRVVGTSTPGHGATRVRYDAAGRVVEVRDTASGLRRFAYDAAGQLVAATNGNGGVTRYEYDARGRAVGVVDPLGHVTRREFDPVGRCVAETDPLGRTTRAGYDAVGRRAWQTDPAGRRTEWEYDAVGRVVGVAVDGVAVSTSTWDVRGRSVELTDHTRPDGRVVRHLTSWNRRGQLVRRCRDDVAVAWTYDAAGRRTSMTLPDGSTVDYGHDEAGRVVSVDHPLLGRATLERDRSGRVVGARAGDLTQSWEHVDGYVVSHTATDGAGSVRTVIGRDQDGRIRSVEREGSTTTFDHDAACQLVAAHVGDRLVRWRYDAAGRLVAETSDDGSRELVHDAAGQLLEVVGPDGSDRHAYDEVGRRVRSDFADGRTRRLEWSPTGWLAGIVDDGGLETVRTRLHVDAVGQLAELDGVAVFWDSADTYAPGLAQVGSAAVVSAGAVHGVGDRWLSPGWRSARSHGDDLWAAARGVREPLAGMPDGVDVGPAGELVIAGLEWLGARVYDAGSRGFLSVDPLDPVVGSGWAGNPYAYAGNDPLHAMDPTGLKPVSEEDLKAANQPWYAKVGTFLKENKDWIIGGVAAVAGVALMATGVGGPAGAMLLSFGADVLIQKATKGEVNYVQATVAGLAGGAGAVATKGLTIGGRLGTPAKVLITAKKVENMSTAAKVTTQVGIGAGGGYGEAVAGGADPLSREALGAGFAGGLTGGLGQRADDLGEAAGKAVHGRMIQGVDEQLWGTRWITRSAARVGEFGTDHAVRGAYTGTVDAGGEFLKQVTDEKDGVDFGKVAGKGVGSGLAKPLPPGAAGATGGGIAAGFDAAVS